MKKYITRFSVTVLAFFVSTTVIYFSVWDTIISSIPTEMIFYSSGGHNSENNSPYSIIDGNTVRIKPYDATFSIPESWLTPPNIDYEPKKNLYLSWQDLNELNHFDFYSRYDFDTKYARVMRTVLPFDDCAAHLGDQGWGNGSAGDLQLRVCIVDLNSQEVTEKIKTRGLGKAQSIFNKASLTSESYGAWERQKIHVLELGSHTLLFEDIDFYYRPFENKTVVFVFVHQSGWDETIKEILDSFKSAN